ALTEARTRAIGLVLARDPEQLELDSFFVRFLSGIERALTPADYALLLQLVSDGEAALHAHERLAAAGGRGGLLLTALRVGGGRTSRSTTSGSRCSKPRAARSCSRGGRSARARSRGWRRATRRGWTPSSSTSSGSATSGSRSSRARRRWSTSRCGGSAGRRRC